MAEHVIDATSVVSGEPSAKRIRPEVPQTLCLRCPSLHNEYQLVHWLFYDNRDALGIAEWYDTADGESHGAATEAKEQGGHLPKIKTSAPLQTVYVSFSRKPYFLIEGPEAFRSRLVDLTKPTKDGDKEEPFMFKNSPVHVMSSTGASVASQKEKVASVDKIHNEKKETTKVVDAPVAEVKANASPRMVPRSVRLAKK